MLTFDAKVNLKETIFYGFETTEYYVVYHIFSPNFTESVENISFHEHNPFCTMQFIFNFKLWPSISNKIMKFVLDWFRFHFEIHEGSYNFKHSLILIMLDWRQNIFFIIAISICHLDALVNPIIASSFWKTISPRDLNDLVLPCYEW